MWARDFTTLSTSLWCLPVTHSVFTAIPSSSDFPWLQTLLILTTIPSTHTHAHMYAYRHTCIYTHVVLI